MGWAGKKNGELLRLAESSGFSVFVTIDQHLREQQNLAKLNIGIIVISARSNSLVDLLPLVSKLEKAIGESQAGTVLSVK